MKKKLLLVVLAMLSFNAIHAEITWNLSDDGKLTISGTDMPEYGLTSAPWYNEREKIKEVVIEDGVTNIGRAAFFGCSNLTSVSIPNTVNRISSYVFWECSAISSIVIPNSVEIIDYLAFFRCSGLKSITIPNSVTSIGGFAFEGCSSLVSITIPKSVMSLGNAIFDGCTNLNSLAVEEGNVNYDSRNNCNAIIETKSNTLISACNTTVIPDDVTAFGDYAFGDIKFTSFIIPDHINSIGKGVFAGCSNLTSITIPSSVTSIGESAFWGCTALNSIVVEKENPIYDSRDNCNAIIETKTNTLISGCKNTVIPNSVTSIGNHAFSALSLASIVIPNSVTTIGEFAFSYCDALTSITIPNSVTSIGYGAFAGCTGLTSVTIPSSVTSIEDNTFYMCSSLTSVTIPNTVTRIGTWAFNDCSSLTSLTIPNSVTSIGERAFQDCTNLTSVTILAENPPVIPLNALGTNVKIYVLAGCKAAYERAECWKDFTIVEEAVTGIDAVERPAMISADKIFSVSGQRLDKAVKGVNIINGKKVYVK